MQGWIYGTGVLEEVPGVQGLPLVPGGGGGGGEARRKNLFKSGKPCFYLDDKDLRY
jgi:hypothetical protein